VSHRSGDVVTANTRDGAKRRMCPVCLENHADTREDVMPKWVRKRIRKLGVYVGDRVPSILMPMCKQCNRKFGHRYENETAPILGPMMDGESRLLMTVDQEIVGRWIVKTTLLGALNQTTAGSPDSERIRRFCCSMRDHGTPPHQSFVRLGAFDREQPIDAQGHGNLHRPGYLPTVHVRGANVSGHVAWQVAIGEPSELERFIASCTDNDSLKLIWPPQLTPVAWPPPVKLTYRDVLTLKLAWNERQWPPSSDGLLPSPIGLPTVGLIKGPHPDGSV
jgi:hypothetical protein